MIKLSNKYSLFEVKGLTNSDQNECAFYYGCQQKASLYINLN